MTANSSLSKIGLAKLVPGEIIAAYLKLHDGHDGAKHKHVFEDMRSFACFGMIIASGTATASSYGWHQVTALPILWSCTQ